MYCYFTLALHFVGSVYRLVTFYHSGNPITTGKQQSCKYKGSKPELFSVFNTILTWIGVLEWNLLIIKLLVLMQWCNAYRHAMYQHYVCQKQCKAFMTSIIRNEGETPWDVKVPLWRFSKNTLSQGKFIHCNLPAILFFLVRLNFCIFILRIYHITGILFCNCL